MTFRSQIAPAYATARIRATRWYRLARFAPGEALLHSENQEATIGLLALEDASLMRSDSVRI